jgi:hypothetical protein
MLAQGAYVSRYIDDAPGAEAERLAKKTAGTETEHGA